LRNCGRKAREIMASKPYPLRIPENLLSLVDSKATEDRTDRSTALRQLLYAGAEDYVIELLKRERISASRAAELLDVSLYKVHELARERGAELASGSEDHDRGRETADQLLG
jgi:predicted HTH domain antitoxin